MAHNRKNIRNAVVNMLSGNTNAGTRVYSNRVTPTWQSELPIVLVYTGEETPVARGVAGNSYYRTLSLVIEIRAEANSSLDDDLDDIATQIEAQIQADQSLNGTASGAILTLTEPELDDSGEKLVGSMSINYDVKYIG